MLVNRYPQLSDNPSSRWNPTQQKSRFHCRGTHREREGSGEHIHDSDLGVRFRLQMAVTGVYLGNDIRKLGYGPSVTMVIYNITGTAPTSSENPPGAVFSPLFR